MVRRAFATVLAALALTGSAVSGRALLTASPAPTNLIPLYNQCGNKAAFDGQFAGKACDTSTAATASCRQVNDGIWQCFADIGSHPPAPSNVVLPVYDQCGGRGGAPPAGSPPVICDYYGPNGSCADAPFPGTVCAAGTVCKRQSEWYYQCLPPATTLFSGVPAMPHGL